MSYHPKTLVVEYTPRGQKSHTKKLLNYFTDLIKGYTHLEFLNLAEDIPDVFDLARIQAYYKRNYEGLTLTPQESKLLSKMDKMRDQLLDTDVLILASPMYNFGCPAPVKAWIDSVIQKGFVYDVNQDGHVPMLQHLKVCTLYTSGIIYDQINENESWNGLVAEGARLFEYMGAQEVRIVHIMGVDMLPENNLRFRTENVAYPKLNSLAQKWYGINIDGKQNPNFITKTAKNK